MWLVTVPCAGIGVHVTVDCGIVMVQRVSRPESWMCGSGVEPPLFSSGLDRHDLVTKAMANSQGVDSGVSCWPNDVAKEPWSII